MSTGIVPVVPASTVSATGAGAKSNVPSGADPRHVEERLVRRRRGRSHVFQFRVAEVAERLADLGRRGVRAGSPCTGRRRRRRSGPPSTCRTCRRSAAGDRRPDALARGDDVDVAAVVAEVGERVVLVVPAPRVAAVAAEAAGLAVRVGEGGHGDDLVVGGRDVPAGVVRVVGRGGDDRDPAARRPGRSPGGGCPCWSGRSCRRPSRTSSTLMLTASNSGRRGVASGRAGRGSSRGRRRTTRAGRSRRR